VIRELPPDKKRKLLKFVTGVSRLPLPGTEILRVDMPFMAISLEEHRAQLQKLPSAHTCTNTIELPNYWQSKLKVDSQENETGSGNTKRGEAELAWILQSKLLLAIEGSDGYGLDQVS
jgi:hypothetical protein